MQFEDKSDKELKQIIAKAKAALLKIQIAERKAKIQKIKALAASIGVTVTINANVKAYDVEWK